MAAGISAESRRAESGYRGEGGQFEFFRGKRQAFYSAAACGLTEGRGRDGVNLTWYFRAPPKPQINWRR